MKNKKNKIARVVIVGRTNVGKSALFNRIAPRTRALVYDEKGVTRDVLKDICEWNGHTFEIVDTAGYTIRTGHDDILKKSITEAHNMFETADIFIFLIDGDAGLTDEDRKLLSHVQKKNTKIIFVVNKADKIDVSESFAFFEGMGIENPVHISALHGRGIEDLFSQIINELDLLTKFKNRDEIEDIRTKVAFLGRPNVGKSSLLNAILNEERSIVSDVAGTTREAISEKIQTEDFSFILSDTAGVRRSRSIDDRLEELMVSNTMSAIERSHIVIMVLDITVDELPDQDIKLAMDAFYELGKAMLVVWNKTDLLEEDSQKKTKILCAKYAHFFDVLPHLYLSAKTKKGVFKIKEEIKNLWKRYTQFFSPLEVKKLLVSAMAKIVMVRNEQKLLIKKVGVIKTCPPTFSAKVTNPAFFGPSQLAFLTRKLRENYDLLGVPVKWNVEKY